jgi:tRNA(fMet)-specific endonuclease VapC
MILDSNAISDWWQGRPALLAVLEKAAAVYLPVPVLAEFRFGILKSTRRAQMEVWFDEAKRLTSILNADADTAECYARIRHNLETQGRRIPMNDLWIAAIAQRHQLPILSQDTHFDAVENLERVSW